MRAAYPPRCAFGDRRDERTGMAKGLFLLFGDKFDGVADRLNRLGGVVRNFDVEFFFEGHYELDDVEAVRAKIVDEARLRLDFGRIDVEMLDDDLLNALSKIRH
jgi:hypothetical protein